MMQATNLYPLPEIPKALRIEDIDLRMALPVNQALAEANATRVMRYLNENTYFTSDLLRLIFAHVQMMGRTPHFVSSRKRLSPAPRSFLTVKTGNERLVFLSKKERLYPKRGMPLYYPYKRITRYLAVTLDTDGAVREINEAVKIFFHFQPNGEGVEIESANLSMRELSVINQLQSEHTARTYAVVTYVGNQAPILARFDQFIGRDLQQLYQMTQRFETIPVSIRLKMARDITKAVQFVHQKEIVHRDIKLENFLVHENGDSIRVYINDFGLSRHVQDEHSRHFKYGTLSWSAPEIAEKTANPSAVAAVDQRSELWSLGLVLYALSGMTHRSIVRLSEVNKINKELQEIQRELALFKRAKAPQNEEEFKRAVSYLVRETSFVIGNKDKETLLSEFDAIIKRLEIGEALSVQAKQEKLIYWRSEIRENRQATAGTVHELKAIAEKLLKIEPNDRASLEEIVRLLDGFHT